MVRVVNRCPVDDRTELPSVTSTLAPDWAGTAERAGIFLFFGQSTTYVDTAGSNPSIAMPPTVIALASATLALVASVWFVTLTDPSALTTTCAVIAAARLIRSQLAPPSAVRSSGEPESVAVCSRIWVRCSVVRSGKAVISRAAASDGALRGCPDFPTWENP